MILGGKLMFRFSNNVFKVSYFISAMLPTYSLFLLIVLTSHIDKFGFQFENIYNFTMQKFLLLFSIVLLISGTICLFIIKQKLRKIIDSSKTKVEREVELTSVVNPGLREFLLGILVPTVSTFSLSDSPVTAIVSFLFFNVILFLFYGQSSDFFPNLGLFLFGYSLIEGILDGRKILVFVQSKEIKHVLNSKQKVVFMGTGSPTKEIVGVYLEKNDGDK